MKKRIILSAALIGLFLFSAQARADTVLKFWADADSYILKAYGGNNYGNGTYLRTRDLDNTSYPEYISRALLQFNQADLETQIGDNEVISASLHLYEYWRGSSTSSEDSINVFRVTKEWTESGESGVTWDNFVDGTEHANQAVAGRMFDNGDTTPGWRSWQSDGLKLLVEKWVSGTDNYGVMLENDLDGDINMMNVKFRSSEFLSGTSKYRPYLKVTVTPEPLSAVLFLVGGISFTAARYRKKSL